MTRLRRAALALVLTVSLLSLVSLGAPADAGSRGVAAQAEKKPKPDPGFNPTTGLRLNDPQARGPARFRGTEQIFRSIEDSKYPARISIATWNFDSGRMVNALVAAHKRGVRVRLLMQGNMARLQSTATGSFWRLKRGLFQPRLKKSHEDAGRSWARLCENACRGHGGILHSKFYLFSKVSKTPWVTTVSSGNATDFAATVQWNDTYTVAGRRKVYQAFLRVFGQMKHDENRHPAYTVVPEGRHRRMIFMPYQGKNTPSEPILRRLEPVRCQGATRPGSDAKHQTVIRIAQTAWMDDRGKAIAERVHQLLDHGCSIRVIYAVMTPKITEVLDRPGPHGPVPRVQITQDLDGDGIYDRYLHMKVLTIRGRYGENTDANFVWNGSENWNKDSLNSDEAGFRVRSRSLVTKYNNWINHLYTHPPVDHVLTVPRSVVARVDPYAKVEIY